MKNNLLYISPVLPAADLQKEMSFFEELGFIHGYDSLNYSEDLDYVVMSRGPVHIHLQHFNEDQLPPGQQIKITVGSISDLQNELISVGMEVPDIQTTPWETREIGFYSPARHAIIFKENI